MISVDSVPVLRSNCSGNDEWLTPTDLIYDNTAGVIWRQQSELTGVSDSSQAIAMRNLLRIGIERIPLARRNANKQRQNSDAAKALKRVTTPHFRRDEKPHVSSSPLACGVLRC